MSCVNIIIDRRKAWVMPESKYSIGGIKNGIAILFFYFIGKFSVGELLNEICPPVSGHTEKTVVDQKI